MDFRSIIPINHHHVYLYQTMPIENTRADTSHTFQYKLYIPKKQNHLLMSERVGDHVVENEERACTHPCCTMFAL